MPLPQVAVPSPPTCNVQVCEYEQESIAECGAGGLRAREEEQQSSDNEVALVALAVEDGLLLGPEAEGSCQERLGPCCTYMSLGPSTSFWVSRHLAVVPFLYAQPSLSCLSLAWFNPSLHLFGGFVPLPLPASFCLCSSFHHLLMFFPFRISPHPILLLLSPPFSPRVFFSSPPATHCLSGIPLYPSRAGRSR